MFLLDTNVLVHYIRDDLLARHIETKYAPLTTGDVPLISVVTVGEIRVLAEEFAWGASRKRAMDDLLAYFTVVPLPFGSIIDAYVEVSEQSRRAGRVLGKNDLWIAATAVTTGATLLTTDRDFDAVSPVPLAREWIDPSLV